MNKILIVQTNVEYYNKNKNDRKTGVWFSETIDFFRIFEKKQNFQIHFASLNGSRIPIDPKSKRIIFLKPWLRKYLKKENIFDNTLKLEEVSFEDYDCVYFCGGHGVMWDFYDNVLIQQLIANMYQNKKIIAAVCHGTIALYNVKVDDNFLIANKKITGFSNLEEILNLTKNKVPYLTEEKLKENRCKYLKSKIPFNSFVIQDGNIITGQNPFSSKKVAKKVLETFKIY